MNIELFLLLWAFRKTGVFRHRLLVAYVVFYGMLRFGLEFFRGDNEAAFVGLTIPQLTGLPFVVAGGAFLLQRPRRAFDELVTRGV